MIASRTTGRGFTLVEVLLVIVIIAMLAGVAIVAFPGILSGAKEDTTRQKLKAVANVLDTYNLHMGHYPTEEEGGLKALTVKPEVDEKAAEKWRGPYLTEDPVDAWGNEFVYMPTAPETSGEKTGPAYTLFSKGPDGQENTEDDVSAQPKSEDYEK
ncbi:MAG: Type II secretion system protein G precursor [Planctomycetes bacterium ADurb.Bin126]|nr:MAG: Type II secretion system protein G precursor [Planctomycetes bacterium ADurb.Bin126]HOD82656.1 type II secretion system major pseudopilin GspG [Phycisphaerae bacterium]HQL75421.1 type II secretion system major pseudopilin GspG [Phycisphaerae bacterium]